ncbi:MAG: Epsin-3, clathrin recruitment and traffic between the Golgi and endosome [Bogoriella megaspora]|nr:MAG: Epsin-3, clathrin recruitment and traffic between the Golgi and endosome [Bogoriella megaspora]
MDFNSIREQVSNISLYDIKAGVRKVQNAVMNYTEMEAKVREATNNEPWGCSTSTMQEIANGTYNYQLLNEIMPMIYKRFTEKAAEEWRQIYKALQLLEFLIKNGSERVIDDARSHLSLLKMLRQFHYIDQNGKDQGINIRNRSKELAELLSDVDRIRAERKKSRATRNKYGGVEGGAGLGGSMSSGSRYGGFSSEDAGSFGGYSSGVYGDGGGFGGNAGGFSDTQSRRDRFEEYDEYDEGAVADHGRRQPDRDPTSARAGVRRETPAAKKAEPPKPKEPEVDLFSFDDSAPTSSIPAPSNGKAPVINSAVGEDDDEFDDFQSATPQTTAPSTSAQPSLSAFPPPTSTTTSATTFAAPQPRPAAQSAQMNDLFSTTSPTPSTTTATSGLTSPPPSTVLIPSATSTSTFAPPPKPTGYQPAGPNYFTSVQSTSSQPASGANTPSLGGSNAQSGSISSSSQGKAKSAGGDPFSSLLAGSAAKKAAASKPQGGSLADMAKQKAQAGIWGATSPSPSQQQQQPAMGGFGGMGAGQGQSQGQRSAGGGDDLLG